VWGLGKLLPDYKLQPEKSYHPIIDSRFFAIRGRWVFKDNLDCSGKIHPGPKCPVESFVLFPGFERAVWPTVSAVNAL
jgi:hypothetical protein